MSATLQPQTPVSRTAIAAVWAGLLLPTGALGFWVGGKWEMLALGRGYVPMAPITATIFVLLAISILLGLKRRSGRLAHGFTVGAMAFSATVAGLVIARERTGRRWAWDGWLAPASAPVGPPLGVMSLATAVMFLGLIVAIGARWPAWRASRGAGRVETAMSGVGLVVSLVMILGYASGAPLGYDRNAVPMALLTAVVFALLNLGVLASGRFGTWARREWLLSGEPDVSQGERTFRRRVGGATMAFVVVGALGAFYFVRTQRADERVTATARLQAVQALKAEELAQWRNERLGEARFLTSTAAVQEDVARLLATPEDDRAREQVLRWLRPIKGGDRYATVWLVDRRGAGLLSVPAGARPPAAAEIVEVLAERTARLFDLHETAAGDLLEVHLVAPVFRPGSAVAPATGEPMAAIVLTVDPRTHLFPLLAAHTAGARSEETLLAKSDETELVFLNEAPGRETKPGRVWRNAAIAQALAGGGEGVHEARDPRGAAVLAGVRSVPDSAWLLVTKLDLAEVYEDTGREIWQMSALVGTLFLAGGFFTSAMWRSRRLSYLTRTLQAEGERNALAARLAMVMQQANDIIMVTDDQDRIIEANQRALDTYGYSLAELQGLPPGGLRSPDSRASYAAQRDALNSQDGVIFETVHQRKDGTTFPVEVSGRVLEFGGRRYKLGIARDITQRRAHEEEIARLTRVHAALSHVNQAIVRARDRETLFGEICRVLVQHGEFTMAWIGGVAADGVRFERLASAGDASGYLGKIVVYADDRPEGRGPTGRAYREGRRYVCNDFFADPSTEPWRETARQAGFAASLALPIRRDDRVDAVLTVYSATRGFFGEKEIQLLEEAAGDVSFALESLDRETARAQAESELRRAQQDFAKAFIASPTAVSINTLAEGRFLDVNEAWERLSGYRREEAVGRTTVELALWSDASVREEVRRRLRHDGRVRSLEARFLRKGGTPMTCLLSAEVISFGHTECILSTIIDITELERAAAAVRVSEARFRALFENSLDGFVLGTPDGAVLAANPAACRMLGRSEAEIIRLGRGAALDPADPRGAALIAERDRTGHARGEVTMIKADGTRFEAEVSSVVFPTDEGPRKSLVFRDVTDRRRAQAALRWEQNLFERLVSSIPDRVYFKDRAGRFLRVNSAMLRALGLKDQAEVEGRSDADFFSETHARRSAEEEQTIMRTGRPLVGSEEQEQWLDGRITWVATTKMPLLDPEGAMIGILGISRDITARKENERRIREQAELIDKANEAIVVVDLGHRITFWSRGAERMLGWTAAETVGKTVPELLALMGVALTPEIEHGLAVLGDWRGEVHGRDRAGTPRVIETSVTVLRDETGRPTGRLSISGDITEHKKLADQFLRAQRLESLGMLAAGIAHDMNNVLAPIGMAAPLLRNSRMDERDLRLLETLEKCAERGAGLVRQILGFAHGVGGEPRLVQVKHLLRDVLNVAAETFPKSITLRDSIPSDLWPVLANPTQIHQVLLNLCVNARDAMPQGGVLRLAAENVRLDATAAAALPGARPAAGC